MTHGDKVSAVFSPVRMDTLRPEMHEFIGRRMTWMYAWTMDEGDPYPGQVAVLDVSRECPYWVPWEDLKDIVVIAGGPEPHTGE